MNPHRFNDTPILSCLWKESIPWAKVHATLQMFGSNGGLMMQRNPGAGATNANAKRLIVPRVSQPFDNRPMIRTVLRTVYNSHHERRSF